MEYGEHNSAGQSRTVRLVEDLGAIEWLQRNVTGSPVVMEAHGGNPYRSIASRIAMYTGLPSVVGWDWHQRQQRAVAPDTLVTSRIADVNTFYNTLDIAEARNILARYGIGFPAALLAAFGLWRQSRDMEANLHMPHLQRTLRLAALALVGYSVFGGLVTPRADFLLAAWLNTERMEQLLIVPVPLVRSLLGLILTVSIIRSLEVFRVELDRRLSSMEEEQVLTTERERIGRELHDGTLQTIYAAGLLLQAVEREVTLHDGAPTAAHLQQSMQLLNQAIADIRSYIGALRSQPTGVSLAAALHDLAGHHHLRSLGDLEVKLDLPDEPPLAPVHLGHLLAIVNEALSNVARHAQATRVQLSAAVVEQQLHLQISDNGHGLSPDYVVGYGLRNMQDRARLLGGSMQIESHGRGMTIRVTVPWDEQTR